VVTKPNGEGYYHIVEGQHRVAAAKIAFGENEHVDAVSSTRKTPPAQPNLAGYQWRQESHPAHQRVLVSVEARREPHTEIAKMVKEMGYKISAAKTDHCIGAVSALVDVHDKFKSLVLRNTLMTLDRTWPGIARPSVDI